MKLFDECFSLFLVVFALLPAYSQSQYGSRYGSQYGSQYESPPTIQEIQVGAIFFDDEIALERAFDAAIESINAEDSNNTFIVQPIIQHLSASDDSETLHSLACELIEKGVAAIFGPSSKADSDIVALICNNTGIPHIQFDMESEEVPVDRANHQMSLNVYPQSMILSKAYADVLQNYGWQKFTIIYDADDPTAMIRLQDLLQFRNVHNEIVRVRKYHQGDDHRVLWKGLRGERRIVLDCKPDYLPQLLNSSAEFELTGDFNYFFLTNLETHLADFSELQDNESFAMNVTSVRLKMDDSLNLDEGMEISHLYFVESETTPAEPNSLLQDLVTDAVNLFAIAMQNLTSIARVRIPPLSCDVGEYGRVRTWGMGQYFYDYMKSISGIDNNLFRVSNLQFDPDGQRINFNLEVYDPLDEHVYALWDTKGQVQPLNVQKAVSKKSVYRIATRIGEPYFMENPEAVEMNYTGNSRYMGYAVDLIEALAVEVGFEYVFVPVADNQYGKYNKETRQWNGIIGEILYNDAHMGICDLTITQARKSVVDFTVPFMQLGISILAFRTPPEPKEVLAFLAPIAPEVWLYVLLAVILVTFAMIFVARISQMEWENPHPCDKNPSTLENMWASSNTTWLAMASIMTAGCDILPKSPTMRCFNAMWWIFAIVIANSYTANLAAFLTQSALGSSITGLQGLVEQTTVKFGTIYGGSTYTYFGDSNETLYRLAFNLMNNDDPSAYTMSNQEGVERVVKNKGNYMFLMETTSLEYNTKRHCELYAIGEKFGEKHYAIAVPFGASYRSALSAAILRLGERGKLFQMKNHWWTSNDTICETTTKVSETPDMNFEEVRGIFYTLGWGLLVAYIVGIWEFVRYCQEISFDEKILLGEVLRRELKFVCSFWINRKAVSVAPSSNDDESEKSEKDADEKTSQTSRKKSSSIRSNSEAHELQSVRSQKSAVGSVRSRVTKI